MSRAAHEPRRVAGVTRGLERYFCAYRSPGNVRELENVVERLVVLARGDSVTYDDLPTYLRKEEPAGSGVPTDLPAEGVSLEHIERDLILKALIKSNWNQTQRATWI
jgi:two-component system NtrC family response regulator